MAASRAACLRPVFVMFPVFVFCVVFRVAATFVNGIVVGLPDWRIGMLKALHTAVVHLARSDGLLAAPNDVRWRHSLH